MPGGRGRNVGKKDAQWSQPKMGHFSDKRQYQTRGRISYSTYTALNNTVSCR